MSSKDLNDGIFTRITNGVRERAGAVRRGIKDFRAMSGAERARALGSFAIANAMYIIITLAVVAIAISEPYLTFSSSRRSSAGKIRVSSHSRSDSSSP